MNLKKNYGLSKPNTQVLVHMEKDYTLEENVTLKPI